ncbi:MAG: CDC48 family AAA ATPase [Candidatus Micrarchaeota archaeon]
MAIELRVKEALQSDVGRAIVRMDPVSMHHLSLYDGDVVLLEKEGKAVGRVWRTQFEERGVIRLDGILRYNASVGLDDTISVSKTDCKAAIEIRLAPSENTDFKDDFNEYLKDRITNIPILPKNSVVIDVMDKAFSFMVLSTVPKGPVYVSAETRVILAKKPAGSPMDIGVRYEDVGGLKEEIETIREMIEVPLKYPVIFKRIGISSPKGILLLGPPGCGKTLLARAVASESEASFFTINGPEIVGSLYGQSEENIRNIFTEAKKNTPSIVFIDEIDAIASKREETSGEVERRIVSQLLIELDGLQNRGDVIVLAATNRPNSLDQALRRPGRFDREVEIRIPDIQGRKEIFQIHIRGMPLKGINLDTLVGMTYGFTGADIHALCREAGMRALKHILLDIKKENKSTLSKELLDQISVTQDDFIAALKIVEPSAIREVFVEIPRTSWSDIGGLNDVKEELIEAVEWPLKYPDIYKKIGVPPPKGILLLGPPGCGKTLLARAVAHESNANFISVKGPEIVSKYVGESEKTIREIFRRARQLSQSVIFLDELDSIAGTRGVDQNRSMERIVNQLLVELDGIEELHKCVVLAATNRPDLIDPSLLRHGRFDKILFVSLPEKAARKAIFRVHTKRMPLSKDVNLASLVDSTAGYTSADIAAICREAGMFSIRENKKAKNVSMKHFTKSFKKIKISMTKKELEFWKSIEEKYK